MAAAWPAGTIISVDAPLGSGRDGAKMTAAELIEDPSPPLPRRSGHRRRLAARDRGLIAEALTSLDDRSRSIVQGRHVQRARTLEDLAQKCRISREPIRQVEAAALEMIRLALPRGQRAALGPVWITS